MNPYLQPRVRRVPTARAEAVELEPRGVEAHEAQAELRDVLVRHLRLDHVRQVEGEGGREPLAGPGRDRLPRDRVRGRAAARPVEDVADVAPGPPLARCVRVWWVVPRSSAVEAHALAGELMRDQERHGGAAAAGVDGAVAAEARRRYFAVAVAVAAAPRPQRPVLVAGQARLWLF